MVSAAVFCGLLSAGVDPTDTKMLSQPAVSQKHIAFIYADDLWIADGEGRNPRRLTAHPGVEGSPVFSPDGKLVSFTGQYDGNTDVFVVPVEGGTPTRLTHHPLPDVVRGFTPDGKQILFASPRNVFTRRYTQFFTVPLEGGMPTQLPIPNANKGSFSPDGKKIAYTPAREAMEQWKNYRGGTHSRIWLYDVATHDIQEIPQPQGRCNDTDPQWIDNDTVAFRSDRNGEFNLFTFKPAEKRVTQATHFEDFPVLAFSVGGGRLVFEQAASLHSMPLPNGAESEPLVTKRLKIGVPADLVETRPRFVKGSEYVRSAGISPSAARAVFEMRGEIFTVPAEKGDARNLTNSPGVHDRSPVWSPDGKTIAYFSDAGGEYQMCFAPQNGKGETRKVKLEGAGFYMSPVWSRDSKKIAYTDNSLALFWMDVASGKITKVAQQKRYTGGGWQLSPSAWSSDSEWLAFTLENDAIMDAAYVYSLKDNKMHQVTDGLSNVSDPVFDANGKYLYFLGSTDTGMSKHGFAQSASDTRPPRQSIYLAVLSKDLPSPFARESDEEKIEEAKKEEEKKDEPRIGNGQDGDDKKDEPAAKDRKGGRGKKGPADEKPAVTKIDVEGLGQRILSFPLPAGNYRDLQAGAANQIYYLSRGEEAGRGRAAGPGDGPPGAELHVYDLEKRKDEVKIASVSGYDLTPDGKKILYALRRDYFIHGAGPASGGAGGGAMAAAGRGGRGGGGGAPPAASGGAAPSADKKLNLDAVEIRIEPRTEWPQIYAEAWRINRDYFYAPNFHGADWKAMKTKYEPFLEHAATRNDVNRITQWLCSELAVGHHRGGGGDRVYTAKNVPGGLLGADYEIADGRYRFKKVYGGLNWNPELRAPLTGPGVNVKAGEYLLKVQGKDLVPPTEVFALFENTSGKSIELTVGPNADGKDSRTVTVEPIADESELRNRAWIENNLKKVHEATGGKVAYVYVPDTAGQGLSYFKRYFFPQVDKEAIIVDERFNSGGQLADYYVDLLRRPQVAHWAPRYGVDWNTPSATIHGPKVMIIDENAGSGGDFLPYMFKKLGLGKLVGKRTWGGLVGISGYPVLMDGATITAPNFAIWTEDGFVIENEGVAPDVDVEQTPKDVIAGRDPQLEKAIEIVMAELKANPPKKAVRPPYPVRAMQPKGAKVGGNPAGN
jgi:tricorn protease